MLKSAIRDRCGMIHMPNGTPIHPLMATMRECASCHVQCSIENGNAACIPGGKLAVGDGNFLVKGMQCSALKFWVIAALPIAVRQCDAAIAIKIQFGIEQAAAGQLDFAFHGKGIEDRIIAEKQDGIICLPDTTHIQIAVELPQAALQASTQCLVGEGLS